MRQHPFLLPAQTFSPAHLSVTLISRILISLKNQSSPPPSNSPHTGELPRYPFSWSYLTPSYTSLNHLPSNCSRDLHHPVNLFEQVWELLVPFSEATTPPEMPPPPLLAASYLPVTPRPSRRHQKVPLNILVISPNFPTRIELGRRRTTELR